MSSPSLNPAYYKLVTKDNRAYACLDCPHAPTCMGGCRARLIRTQGTTEGNYCAREYLDAYVPAVLSALYRPIS